MHRHLLVGKEMPAEDFSRAGRWDLGSAVVTYVA
jgi:hypothetical protein